MATAAITDATSARMLGERLAAGDDAAARFLLRTAITIARSASRVARDDSLELASMLIEAVYDDDLALLRRAPDPVKAGAWLRGVAKRLAKERARARGRHRRALAAAAESASVRPHEVGAANRQRVLAAATAAAATVAEPFRRVAVARWIEGRPAGEVAPEECLRDGIAPATARWRIGRAWHLLLAAIRDALAPGEGVGPRG